jgi:membrane protease YdiL (CAAX protease family)
VARVLSVYLSFAAFLVGTSLFVASGLTFGAHWAPALAFAAACVSLLPLASAQAWAVHDRVRAQVGPEASALRHLTDDLAGILASTAFLLCVPVLLESAHGVAAVGLAASRALEAWGEGSAASPAMLLRHHLALVRTASGDAGAVRALGAWVSVLTLAGATLSGASLWLRLRGVVGPGQLRRTFALREPSVRAVALATLAGALAGWLPASVAYQLGEGSEPSALGAFVRGADALRDFHALGVPSLAWTLAIAAALPMAEELGFRGFLWSAFARAGSPGTALALSTLAFTLLHHDPSTLPSAAFLGLMLGLLRANTRSVVPCMVAHVALNSLGIAAMALWPDGLHVPLAPAAVLGGLALLAAGSTPGRAEPLPSARPPRVTRTA